MFCTQAKEYLSQRNMPFMNKDITKGPNALEELKKLGFFTPPVLVIDGTAIVGFDVAKIESALT